MCAAKRRTEAVGLFCAAHAVQSDDTTDRFNARWLWSLVPQRTSPQGSCSYAVLRCNQHIVRDYVQWLRR